MAGLSEMALLPKALLRNPGRNWPVAELWQAAAFLCPGFLPLVNKLYGLRDESGK